jgi:hypothetical protein
MRSLSLGRHALSGGVSVALLAGCGGSQPADRFGGLFTGIFLTGSRLKIPRLKGQSQLSCKGLSAHLLTAKERSS